MKKSKVLLASGILICSFSQIITHYFSLEDSFKGLFMGFGIGALLIGLLQLKNNYKRTM